PNGATVLFLTDGAESANIGKYDLCCELFDGNADDAVAAARERWKRYLESAHALTYWQQGDAGGWEKKAETAG
ncbi:MAG: DNA polymerase III subunit chi, partial [Rhodospirillaceae bacterium]|nr:DNA polymerase III subunit chi [Rhodospirillaceae bacterium]